jgi:diacylglycerol kinase family enzyme
LGVLPQGTFNYFSRTYGIPTDSAEATRVILHGGVHPVQVGRVNDRLFLVNASVGLYPQLLEDREAYKKQFGRSRLVAVWAGIMTIVRGYSPLVLQLDHEDTAQVVPTPTLVVGNNELQLAALGIPEVSALRQGQLAAITLRPVGTLAMFWLLLRGPMGQLGEAADVRSFAFNHLTVRLRRPYGRRRLKVATDGEVTWLRLPLVFEVAPTPLLLLVPPRETARAEQG